MEKIAYGISVGKPEGERPLGRPKRKWVGNTTVGLRMGIWPRIAYVPLEGSCDHGDEPPNSIKY
jgi:hypothetical protein